MVKGASPGPGQQFPAHPVQLPHVSPAEAAQEGAQSLPSRKRGGGRGLDHTSQDPGRTATAQRISIVDAVASSQSLPPRKRGAEATRVISLSPLLARPGESPRSRYRSTT